MSKGKAKAKDVTAIINKPTTPSAPAHDVDKSKLRSDARPGTRKVSTTRELVVLRFDVKY